jgi:hypothetical protein
MKRTGTLIGLISLLLIALEPSSAQEQAPSTTTPNDSPPIKKLGKMRSTGSAILHKACIAAATAARFTPELQNGTRCGFHRYRDLLVKLWKPQPYRGASAGVK